MGNALFAALKKKLETLIKKGLDQVGRWRNSIVNHLWWTVGSSAGLPAEEIQEKWLR